MNVRLSVLMLVIYKSFIFLLTESLTSLTYVLAAIVIVYDVLIIHDI